MSMEEFADFSERIEEVGEQELTYKEDLEFEGKMNEDEFEMIEDYKFEEFFTSTLKEKDFKKYRKEVK